MPKKFIISLVCAFALCGCSASGDSAAEVMDMDSMAMGASQAVIREESCNYGFSVAETGSAKTTTDGAPGENHPLEDRGDPGEEPEFSDQHFFSFDVKTNSIAHDDGTELLFELYCSPSFTADNPRLQEWVNTILAQINQSYVANSNNLLRYAQEDYQSQGEAFYSYSNYLVLGVGRHDSMVTSLISLSSVYSGGSHPNSVQTAYNMDMRNEKLLVLEDVILEEGTGELRDLVLAGIEEKFSTVGTGALFDDYQQTVRSSLEFGTLTPYWYFNNQGLVLFFNQYELGPYSAGIVKVEIAYEDLDGILRSEYFPEETDASGGNMVYRSDADGYRRIPVTLEDGEQILIGVEGCVYQVQLSEIYWTNGIPVLKQMLFSANNMTQSDVLEVMGGFTDGDRSFALEFVDGSGQTLVYYVGEDGLKTEP